MKQTFGRRLGGLLLAGVGLLATSSVMAQASRAALTRDVDRPEAQPVHGICSNPAYGGSVKCTLYKVPAGKRLVVEMVGYTAGAEPSRDVYQILIGQGDAFVGSSNALFSDNLFVVAPTMVLSSTSNKFYSNTHQVRIYLDEGSILVGGLSTTGVAGFVGTFSFSGYLVDK